MLSIYVLLGLNFMYVSVFGGVKNWFVWVVFVVFVFGLLTFFWWLGKDDTSTQYG